MCLDKSKPSCVIAVEIYDKRDAEVHIEGSLDEIIAGVFVAINEIAERSGVPAMSLLMDIFALMKMSNERESPDRSEQPGQGEKDITKI